MVLIDTVPIPVLLNQQQVLDRQTDERCALARVVKDAIMFVAEVKEEIEGSEQMGVLVTVGDADRVLDRSFPIEADPLKDHPLAMRLLSREVFRRTLKRLVHYRGALVVDDQGRVVASNRYLYPPDVQLDLHSDDARREVAARSITKISKCHAVVLLKNGDIQVYRRGRLVEELLLVVSV